MDTDEEDVIFEGSPLYSYLKVACPTEEFESSLPQSNDVLQANPVSQATNECGYFRMFSTGIGIPYITCAIKRLLSWPSLPDHVRYNQTGCCQQKILSMVTMSKLLNEADQSLLTSLVRCLEAERYPYQPTSLLPIFISGSLFLGASLCFLLPPGMMATSMERPADTATGWLELLLGAFSLVTALRVYWTGITQGRLSRVHRHLDKEMGSHIHQEETFHKCFRRSLQYIQEVEVISRGYTMVNVPSGKKDSSGLELVPLRKVCLLVITRHLAALRAATGRLMERFPVPAEYELSKECISHQEIPEWITDMATQQQTLGTCHDDEEELYTLSTLKILFGLYKEQCSDFYRQLVVSFVFSDEFSRPEGTEVQRLRIWLGFATTISTESEESTQRLSQTYKVHRWSPTPEEGTSRRREISRREVWRPEVQCTTAVHSLRLHLETMLARFSAIDDELSDSEAISLTERKVAELQRLLVEVGDHMEASQICYQEAKASLEKLTQKEEPLGTSAGENIEKPKATTSQEPMERIAITAEYSEDIDGDLDEQIFEAYIDAKKRQVQEEDSEEWQQERIQKRREAEDAKRMLLELNSVLTKRSKEREKTKQEKILRQQAEEQLATGGTGESNNSVQPNTNEYSSLGPAANGSTASPPRNLIPGQIDSESHEDEVSDSEGSSADIARHGEGLLEPSCEYPSGTLRVSSNRSSIDSVRSPCDDMAGCGDHPHDDSSKPDNSEFLHNWNSFDSIKQSHNPAEAERDLSDPHESISNKHDNFPRRGISQFACSQHNSSMQSNIESEGNGREVHSVQALQSVQIGDNDSPKKEQEKISNESPPGSCSYECEGGHPNGLVAAPGLPGERSPYLPVNPWMNSGLAAQVARISLERNNLSEETFGEDDSDGS